MNKIALLLCVLLLYGCVSTGTLVGIGTVLGSMGGSYHVNKKHRIFQSQKDKECEFWWGEDSDYSWTEDGCWTYHDEESCIEEGGKMMSRIFKNSTCLMPLEMIDENVDGKSEDSLP